ncbi:MAG: hypothetical protein QOJ02_2271 [Acidobacteriota bacterium]|nr:hypothetical protein [Acidobacteriota bacterium]
MSGLTRSLVLLLVLAPLVDVAWRSPWFHLMSRSFKVSVTVLLICIYLVVAGTLILNDYNSAALAFQIYLKSGRAERLFRWVYFLAGFIAAYFSLKLFSLLKGYLKTRKAEELVVGQRFRETQKGWLDYRLESEESSKRLHFFVGRLARETGRFGMALRIAKWSIGKEGKKPDVVRAKMAVSWIALAGGIVSPKMEADLKEFDDTANSFIESTEGYLKTLEIVTKRDFEQLAGLHEYFQAQLNDIHKLANTIAKLPPIFKQVRGVSQDSTAAVNRLMDSWKLQIEIMRKVEGHCARMVKLTQSHFDRSLKKASLELVSALRSLVKTMRKETP